MQRVPRDQQGQQDQPGQQVPAPPSCSRTSTDGTLLSGTGTVTHTANSGIYEIDFGTDVSNCAGVASNHAGRSIAGVFMGEPNSNTVSLLWSFFDPHPPAPKLPLEYYNNDVSFHLIVACN